MSAMQFTNLARQYQALKADIDARIQRVLDHGQYILGPEVAELESELARYTGAAHCVTLASGTDALLVALMALDIGPGDEVVTTPFSFAATAEVIVRLGARPVFVDVEVDTGNIDATLVEAAITPRTRALMPVSLYGQPADMAALNAIAARHGLPVVEDAAQSFGGTQAGVRSTHLSTIGCTSFFPSKPLGCYGDGGALFTDDDQLAAAAREIRVHGQSARYTHTRLGIAGRMDTLQCAVVLAKLARFDEELARRAAIAERYSTGLQPLAAERDLLRLPQLKPGRTSAWAQYTVQLGDAAPPRQAVIDTLTAQGIPTAVHYPTTLPRQPAFAAAAEGNAPCAISEAVSRRVLSLPMSADLSDDEQDHVVGALQAALRGARSGR